VYLQSFLRLLLSPPASDYNRLYQSAHSRAFTPRRDANPYAGPHLPGHTSVSVPLLPLRLSAPLTTC